MIYTKYRPYSDEELFNMWQECKFQLTPNDNTILIGELFFRLQSQEANHGKEREMDSESDKTPGCAAEVSSCKER